MAEGLWGKITNYKNVWKIHIEKLLFYKLWVVSKMCLGGPKNNTGYCNFSWLTHQYLIVRTYCWRHHTHWSLDMKIEVGCPLSTCWLFACWVAFKDGEGAMLATGGEIINSLIQLRALWVAIMTMKPNMSMGEKVVPMFEQLHLHSLLVFKVYFVRKKKSQILQFLPSSWGAHRLQEWSYHFYSVNAHSVKMFSKFVFL